MNNRYINYKQFDKVEFGSKNVDLANMAKIYKKQKFALMLSKKLFNERKMKEIKIVVT